MKIKKLIVGLVCLIICSSCASKYQSIQPLSTNYRSVEINEGVKIAYKYDLLSKKYLKKETKNGIKLVALEITNNSGQDLTFGNGLNLVYKSGETVMMLPYNKTYKTLKQNTLSYLWYLLLTPMNLTTTSTNSYGYTETENIFPVGLILGPAIAGTNMLIADKNNKKLEKELIDYNIIGKVIKNGETAYGLIGIETRTAEALKPQLTIPKN